MVKKCGRRFFRLTETRLKFKVIREKGLKTALALKKQKDRCELNPGEPIVSEVHGFMLDVEKNLDKAVRELKYKFDRFVRGNSTGTRADDPIAE